MDTSNTAPRFALLIGAGNYSAYDTSTGSPSKTNNLPGAVQDVASMYSLSLALGVAPGDIYVLLTPTHGGDASTDLKRAYLDASPGTIKPATKNEILAGLDWLAQKLEGSKNASALVTWSGHGDFVGDELALCPSDVVSSGAGKDLTNAISFAELRAYFERPSFANTTLVLDCCHAGAVTGAKRAVSGSASLTGRPLPAKTDVRPLSVRTIAATKAGEKSEQSTFDGVSHGALTWALKVVLDQWKVNNPGTGEEITITYDELRRRVDRLLTALSFEQRVQLAGGSDVGGLPFFHSGARGAGMTSSHPDRARPGAQIEPEPNAAYITYAITVLDSKNNVYFTGSLIVTGNVQDPYGKFTKLKEYLILPQNPQQGATDNWDQLQCYGGTPTLQSMTFGEAVVTNQWPSVNPFANNYVVPLEPANVSWGAPSLTSHHGNALVRFYKEIDMNSSSICAVGVAANNANANQPIGLSFEILGSNPAFGSYVVPKAGRVFDLTTAPTPTNGAEWWISLGS